MAEGSDWFWWFGEDQDSGNDDEFDDLFITHLGCSGQDICCKGDEHTVQIATLRP